MSLLDCLHCWDTPCTCAGGTGALAKVARAYGYNVADGSADTSGIERFKADAQALADVRTLDEWARSRPRSQPWECFPCGDGTTACILKEHANSEGVWHYGPTPDAARHAAAEWVRASQAQNPALGITNDTAQQSGSSQACTCPHNGIRPVLNARCALHGQPAAEARLADHTAKVQSMTKEVWRCSYTALSGREVDVQWCETADARDAYMAVAPIKGKPVAVRYVPDPAAPARPEAESLPGHCPRCEEPLPTACDGEGCPMADRQWYCCGCRAPVAGPGARCVACGDTHVLDQLLAPSEPAEPKLPSTRLYGGRAMSVESVGPIAREALASARLDGETHCLPEPAGDAGHKACKHGYGNVDTGVNNKK